MGEVCDLIIVGAGTAGCIVAERLTSSSKLRVLLIEAGGRPSSRFVSIPAGFPRLFKGPLDWAFESAPQNAVGGRRIFTPRGKMLGGSANMNAMMHQWCHPADFDGWVESGAPGWSWNDVAPVFRAQERWLGDDGDPGRGRDGPMVIAPNRNARSLTLKFVEAARRAGFGREAQYNGRAYHGAWIAELHVDSPNVGEHLQDHPLLPVVFRTRSTDTLKNAESPLNLLRYLVFKRGMLASNGTEGFAFTQVQPGPVAAPDLELVFLPFEWRNQGLEPPQEHAFGIGAAVVAPRSRGRLRLRNPDPLAPPVIDFGLLSDPEGIDASVLWEGVRLSRKIAATSPLAEENAGELRPGASAESDSELLAYASAELQTVYHPTSTCRMGSDRSAVVDAQLRVRGVDGLWVADASVMPSVPRGHPNAVVAMIAERAARWIERAVAG
jgi:choline dehydrogenase-like flavoprotein